MYCILAKLISPTAPTEVIESDHMDTKVTWKLQNFAGEEHATCPKRAPIIALEPEKVALRILKQVILTSNQKFVRI